MTPTRPLLRYHGGKWRLAPWIIAHLPPHRIYVEPFGGGASVLLRKPRSYGECYNDLDNEVVNLFRMVRERGIELRDVLLATPFARAEFQLSYKRAPDELEQARRTIVRSFMGFGSNSHKNNSGFRATSNRSGTTPAHDWMHYPDLLHRLTQRLQGVVIENRDACEVMRHQDGQDTLHYVDPPYVHETRRLTARHRSKTRTDYRHEMTDGDHRRLAEVLHGLQGMVVLSGYPCELYQQLYAGWESTKCHALADGARPRTEVLWFNPAAAARTCRQGTLLQEGCAA